MSKRGADLLVEALIAADVGHIFSLSGNQIMPLYDALLGQGIKLIHTRHEAAAVHMADAWGRLTEQPGVALLTAGPGHCNAISALYVALMAESPLVLLSGHAPLSQQGQGAFQELDQVAIAKPVTKAAWLVRHADDLASDFAKAFAIAQTGRPGPVHLSLPADVLTQVTAASASQAVPLTEPTPLPPEMPGQLLQQLATAKKPLILAGSAMARPDRWADVAHLSEITGIPALPIQSPRGLNDPWLHFAKQALAEADVVLLLGKPLNFSLRFGQAPAFLETCQFMQIDADQAALGNDSRLSQKITADPTLAVQALAVVASEHTWPVSSWRAQVAELRQTIPAAWSALAASTETPIHPLRLAAEIQPYVDQGGIFISDGGEIGQWMQAQLAAEIRLINGASGSIGSAISLGLAAQVAHPDRRVFVTLGDGTFGFHALELDTAVRYNLPIIVIIGNDARWNAEYQIQTRDYGPDRTFGCELLPTRYDQLVIALGGHGEFVEHPADLSSALERAIASGRPACINVMIAGVAAPTL